MCYTADFLHFVPHEWTFHSVSRCLWLLCGHLSPSALHSSHITKSMLGSGSSPLLYSAFVSLITTIKIFISSFCGWNVISHFYCDSLILLTLLCSSTWEIELFILTCSMFNLVPSLLIALVSYILILKASLRMNTAQGRHKDFCTCGSQLTVVVV